MKPMIGITCNYDYRDEAGLVTHMGIEGQDWNFIAGDYISFLEKAGAIPVVIPLCSDFENVKRIIDGLDGVLISGGHDIGPENYGVFPKDYCGTVIPMRDKQDIAIAKYAVSERHIPVLGICRGIQIINVAFGGSLYQDLEKEGGFEHHFGDKYPRNYGWHQVCLEDNSIVSDIFGRKEVTVNSFHHQAVFKPGRDIKITASSSDGVPEVIESEKEKFVVGIQWHPEMMYDSEEQLKISKAFVKACEK